MSPRNHHNSTTHFQEMSRFNAAIPDEQFANQQHSLQPTIVSHAFSRIQQSDINDNFASQHLISTSTTV